VRFDSTLKVFVIHSEIHGRWKGRTTTPSISSGQGEKMDSLVIETTNGFADFFDKCAFFLFTAALATEHQNTPCDSDGSLFRKSCDLGVFPAACTSLQYARAQRVRPLQLQHAISPQQSLQLIKDLLFQNPMVLSLKPGHRYLNYIEQLT
jgi:hypothetical protein